MARITTHEIAYAFQEEIVARLRSLRVPRAKTVADDIVPKLVAHIPTEAFDTKPIWERGLIHFHGDFTEAACVDSHEELMAIHHNIKAGIPILVYLSSLGGSVESGLALFSTVQEIRRQGRKVNCHIQGVAMSMGSILAQACDVRTIEPFAAMMVHGMSDAPPESKNCDLEDRVAFNRTWETIINGLYSARSGKPVEYWRGKMERRDWYLTARQAVSEGLADKMTPIQPYHPRRSIAKPSTRTI